jgi:hypothetical protein
MLSQLDPSPVPPIIPTTMSTDATTAIRTSQSKGDNGVLLPGGGGCPFLFGGSHPPGPLAVTVASMPVRIGELTAASATAAELGELGLDTFRDVGPAVRPPVDGHPGQLDGMRPVHISS